MSSIRVLRTFAAVAGEGSFAAAAGRVALTQAAVGQQMRALEGELRRPLFERQGKTVVLNEAGRALVLYGEPMVLLAPRKLEETDPRVLLRQQPFIRFDPSQHTGRLVDRSLRRLRVKPQEFLELNALESIVELVRSGLGVSIVPLLRGARWTADAKLRVIELPEAQERKLGLVQRRDSGKGAVIAALARELA
jgi:DNA-binding transcriptional LysR family regulator